MNTLNFLTATDNFAPPSSPDERLALGVLHQVAHDLRKFHHATRGIERELYLDAYAWIIASDFSWPYSFVNICKLLDVSPETLRADLMADVSRGWIRHWVARGKHFGRSFRDSLRSAITRSCKADAPELGETRVYRLRHS